jgi:hypothetical protein
VNLDLALAGMRKQAEQETARKENQAVFLRLHVHDDTIEHADIAEPFATLTTPSLPHELGHGAASTTRPPSLPTAAVQIRIK